MNQDHVEALTLYLRVLAGIEAEGAPRMTAIDRLGFEVQCTAGGKEHVERFPWEGEVVTPDQARHALIALVRKARSAP